MLFSRTPPAHTGAVLMLGAGSVSAALFHVGGKDKIPRILAKEHKTIDSEKFIVQQQTFRLLREAVHHTLGEAAKKEASMPEIVYIGLESPFYISKTILISRERKNPRLPLQKEELDNIIESGETEFVKSTFTGDFDDLKIFFREPIRIFLNGYPTKRAIGIAAKTIDLWIRYEATSEKLIESLNASIQPQFPHGKLLFSSLPTAYFSTLSYVTNLDDGLILIDIREEITELSFIIHNVLMKSVSIASGTETLARRLRDSRKYSLSEARSFLNTYAHQSLADRAKSLLQPLLKESINEWLKHVTLELKAFEQEEELPNRIFLVGVGASYDVYKDALNSQPTDAPFPHFTVTTLTTSAFQEHVQLANLSTGPEEFALASLLLQVSKNYL